MTLFETLDNFVKGSKRMVFLKGDFTFDMHKDFKLQFDGPILSAKVRST